MFEGWKILAPPPPERKFCNFPLKSKIFRPQYPPSLEVIEKLLKPLVAGPILLSLQ